MARSVSKNLRQRARRLATHRKFRRSLRESDVFIVGHPKSGNTWLTYMIAHLKYAGRDEDVTLAALPRLVPFMHGRDSEIAAYDELLEPRIFRNEWPHFPDLYPRSIYLLRDPRAVVVSYYHHYVAATGRDETIGSFVKRYLGDGCITDFEPALKRWDVQVMEWRERSQRQPVLFVRYEEMIAARERVLRNAAGFIGLPVEGPAFEASVAMGAFETMRADEAAHGTESYPGVIGQRARFIRRGEAEGWRDELDQPLVGYIAREFAEPMEVFGYAP
jgi:hypothetical protein